MYPLISAILGLVAGQTFKYFPVISATASTLPVIVLLLKRSFITAIVCTILTASGFFYTLSIEKEELSNEDRLITIRGEVLSGKENVYQFRDWEGKFFRVFTKETLEREKSYHIECKKVEDAKNPYNLTQSSFCYALKVVDEGVIEKKFLRKIQDKINYKLRETLESPTSAVLVAMTTGARFEIPKETREDFKKTGLIHLLSISGAHFSLLFAFFYAIFRLGAKLIPYRILIRMSLHIKPSQLATLLCFPPLLFYFLLIEPNYPSTRAFIMSLLFMVGVISERSSLWLRTVSIACLIILLIEPNSFFDLSFQLSFLAVLGIGFVSDIYKEHKEEIKSKVLSYFLISLLVSLGATLFTAPLVIYKFHYLSLISPIANLTAGLLIGMILFPLNVVFVFFYLIFGVYPFPELINSIGSLSFKLIHWLASLSFSSLNLPPIAAGFVLLFYGGAFLCLFTYYRTKGGLKRGLILTSLATMVFSLVASLYFIQKEREYLKITFLDVGQADSLVIETPKELFLVDTGKGGYEAQQFLKAKGHSKINALVLTHEQRDHAGGAFRILENFRVDEVWHNGYLKFYPQLEIKQRTLERGHIVKTETCTFTVLHPYRGFYHSSLERDSNELSLVFRLKCFDRIYLFTADAGANALETIPKDYLRADLIKVPHHGSKSSFFAEFYEAVNPEICLISVGKRNPHGHPHREVIDYLSQKCKIYRTDHHGAIQIKEGIDGKIKVQTFEDTRFKPFRDWENLKKLFVLW